MSFDKLLTKGTIGSVRLKNRVVQTAMAVGYSELNGEVSERLIRFYEERAKGGVGLIITEVVCVNEKHGIGTLRQMHATSLKYLLGMNQLTDTIHRYDTRIFAQLHHGGNTNKPYLNGGELVSASNIPCAGGEIPRPLTTEEVQSLVKDFINAAVLCKQAGFDGVEIHGAHGYLITQFMSGFYNKRTDQYGGSFENRMRLSKEIIRGIRSACGKDFAISLRMNGDDFLEGIQEGNLTLEDGVRIAKYMESAGVDVLNVSCATTYSGYTIVEPYFYPAGWRKHVTKAIKDAVKIPVIGTNTIKSPEFAEQLLEEGVSDFVGIARALLCDPEWTNKAAEGRSDEIRKCVGCMSCFESLVTTASVRCGLNPRTGNELIYDSIKKAGKRQAVAVIGGGPAGMQAAMTLSERGYEVTLYEKGGQLGGTLNLADKPPFKEKLEVLKDTMIRQMEAAGVNVCLNTQATPELVSGLNPAGVFLASGAQPIRPRIDGVERSNVHFAESVLEGKVQLQGKVTVIGSGMTGLETAEILQNQGCKVSVVEMLPAIGPGIFPVLQMAALKRLKDTVFYAGHQLEAIDDKGAILLKLDTGESVHLAADHIVLSLGVVPSRETVAAFDEKFDRVIVLGDANRGGKISNAIKDAYIQAVTF